MNTHELTFLFFFFLICGHLFIGCRRESSHSMRKWHCLPLFHSVWITAEKLHWATAHRTPCGISFPPSPGVQQELKCWDGLKDAAAYHFVPIKFPLKILSSSLSTHSLRDESSKNNLLHFLWGPPRLYFNKSVGWPSEVLFVENSSTTASHYSLVEVNPYGLL